MQRFKDAGLNPNLIYGQGSEGNATSVRQSESGRWSPESTNPGQAASNAVDSWMQYQGLDNQMKTSELNREGIAIDNANKTIDGLIKMEVLGNKKFSNSNQQELYDQRLSTLRAQQSLIQHQGGVAASQTNLNSQKLWMLNERFPKSIS